MSGRILESVRFNGSHLNRLILVGLAACSALDCHAAPVIAAQSAIVVDAKTGRVLYQKNADVQRPVASTQKLLTGLIVIQNGDLDGKVKVKSTDTEVEPTVIGIKAGQSYTRQQLVVSLLVKSGNDVAKCLARDQAGSSASFATMMNERARSIGMRNSNFVSPNGLPAKGQFSTARDMARLAMVAYRNPTIRSIVKMKSMRFQFPNGNVKVLENIAHDQALAMYKDFDLFVLPSRDEPAAYSPVEAFSRKLPVIASDTCGTSCRAIALRDVKPCIPLKKYF
jgi:D-alanyl-D-alanine carboxypeptidase